MKGYPTIYQNVIFVECDVPEMQSVAPVSVDLSFVLGAQLKNLNDVKQRLAAKAAQMDCNCVANFKYGQKSRWLAIDDVAFFGNGVAGKLSAEEYSKICEYIAQRDNS